MNKSIAVVVMLVAACGPATQQDAPSAVEQSIERAADEFGVPAHLLEAHAWSVSRMRPEVAEAAAREHHHATPTYGIMGLVDGTTLQEGAQLLQVDPVELTTSQRQNIRAGAALFARYHEETGDWWEALALLSGATSESAAWQHAIEVYRIHRSGEAVWRQRGEVRVQWRSLAAGGTELLETLGMPPALQYGTSEYPFAYWAPADSSNYTNSNRPSTYPIEYIVIHTVQGSYGGAISWFQNPSANVSAEFVVRSSDGEITQMVKHDDYAWHAGNSYYNRRAIGIEHEGFVDDASWYTDAMYESSAALSRWIIDQYGVSFDRDHILGHVEVPNATHSDPGPNWDWDYYMALISQEAADAKLVGYIREDDIYDGSGIGGATVELDSGETTTTAADGYYEITGLEPGTYTVTVSAPGYAPASDSKDVTDGFGTFWKSVALSASATPDWGVDDRIADQTPPESPGADPAEPSVGCALAGPVSQAPAALLLGLLAGLGAIALRRRF